MQDGVKDKEVTPPREKVNEAEEDMSDGFRKAPTKLPPTMRMADEVMRVTAPPQRRQPTLIAHAVGQNQFAPTLPNPNPTKRKHTSRVCDVRRMANKRFPHRMPPHSFLFCSF